MVELSDTDFVIWLFLIGAVFGHALRLTIKKSYGPAALKKVDNIYYGVIAPFVALYSVYRLLIGDSTWWLAMTAITLLGMYLYFNPPSREETF